MNAQMVVAVFVGVAVLLAVGFFAWQVYRAGSAARGGDQALALLQQQLENLRAQLSETLNGQTQSVNQQIHQLTEQVNHQLRGVSDNVVNSQKSMGERLDNAARVVGEVQKSLGSLGQASERIFEVGKNIAGLQAILQAPKLRGGFGEYFLEDLLAQILPAKHFEMQHSFKNGDTVDAVLRLGGRLVPVDSKFPLENFRRFVETGPEEEKRQLKRKFTTDVKKHIDAIASKYILPDEGTYNFAFMYVPAENVYYEVIVKDENGGEEKSLTEFALGKKVIPVSPNSFYAYLQAIILGLRGLDIEENAHLIMQNLSRLQGDFARFREDFDTMGRHLSNTKSKYDEAEKRLGRVQDKLHAIGSQDDEKEKTPLLTTLPKA